MSAGAHGHHHGHRHGPSSDGGNRRRLLWVLALNGGYLVVELVAGLLLGSLVLLADAAHMASDVAGLVIAIAAQTLLTRAPTARLTFGLIRSEVLAALANGLLLAGTGVWVIYEAVERLSDPPPVEGGLVAMVAVVGLAINLGSAWVLFGRRHENLNMRGAYLHMAADAAGSVVAVAAGVAIAFGGGAWLDPLLSVVVAAIVIHSAWGLGREAIHVLLEGAPAHIDLDDIVDDVRGIEGVDDLHHLHLWHLSSVSFALSGHLVVDGDDATLHDAQRIGDRVRALLHDRYGVVHATLELECHPCGPREGHAVEAGRSDRDG